MIRRNCFETNSSSMHSIVVTKDKENYTEEELKRGIYLYKDGELHVWGSDLEFGRSPFHILTTFEEKLMYAIASFCGGYMDEEEADENFDMIEEIARKYIPDLTSIKVPEKYETIFIKEDGTEIGGLSVWEEDDEYYYHHNGEKEKVTRSDYDNVSPDYGYVDHQSAGLLNGFLNKHGISLEEFLINKKYNVIIDGDEYCYWESLLNSSLINKENIEFQYPEHDSYSYLEYLESEEEEGKSKCE